MKHTSQIVLDPPSYDEQTWSHRGLELCFYVWGTPSENKPTLLFLHGWLDHGASWNTVGNRLSRLGYHCIALDHRGHGHSAHIPPYEEYHFADYIADLQTFIIEQKITDFVLIGHSMGGTIASIYSALAKHTPSHCILVDGLGPKHETPTEATHRLKVHLSQRRRLVTHRSMSVETACAKLQRAHPFLSTTSVQQECQRLTVPVLSKDTSTSSEVVWRWDPRHRNKSAIGFDLSRFLDLLTHISCPVDCIFGKDSWYLQLSDLPSRLKAVSTLNETIHLPSGHSPHLECPELLVAAIRNALQKTQTIE
jgi:pimeloyl-ACP methyl ester carboxylesterase